MAKRVLVFAGSVEQARRYVQSTGRSPLEFAIVTGSEMIVGLEPKEYNIVATGTWRENPKVVEAYDAWRVRVKTHHKVSANARG